MAARVKPDNSDLTNFSKEEISAALERILASKHFVHAPKKQKFLRLVCEFYLTGRASELNEYLIGREVFDRDDSYNPSADPIVRVGAHDVRKKLELYYDGEGAGDSIRLEIRVGSYEPNFVRCAVASDEPIVTAPVQTLPVIPRAPSTSHKKAVLVLALAVVSLLVTVLMLVSSNQSLRNQVDEINLSRDGAAYGSVWEPFLKADDLTLLVISNPSVYRFSNAIDPDIILKKSVGLTEDQADNLASALKDKFVMKQNRIPRLVLSNEDYTGMGEAIGLHRITDLFRSTGKGFLLKQSRTASAEDLKNHDVILLGSVWSNEWAGKLPVKEDFIYSGNATIQNRNPQPGEEAEYKPHFDPITGELTTDYALVTVKPNISFEDTVMVLAGVHSEGTEAAVEYVTVKNYLSDLNQRLSQSTGAGTRRYYQALLKVGVENGIPTTVSLVAFHELNVVRD
jgi:hypothetical protein